MEDENDENDERGGESESEDNETVEWLNRLRSIHVDDFTSRVGITFDIGNEAREIDVCKMFFNNEIIDVIVRETNRYARQKLEGQALDKWQDVTLNEIKAFLGVCIVMAVNSLPSTAEYWSSDPFLGNEGIQKVMTKNQPIFFISTTRRWNQGEEKMTMIVFTKCGQFLPTSIPKYKIHSPTVFVLLDFWAVHLTIHQAEIEKILHPQTFDRSQQKPVSANLTNNMYLKSFLLPWNYMYSQ